MIVVPNQGVVIVTIYNIKENFVGKIRQASLNNMCSNLGLKVTFIFSKIYK